MRNTLALGVLLGTMIGAGIFALPQIIMLSGWVAFSLELFFLALILAYVHNLYARVLYKSEEKNLLGLLRDRLGRGWFYLGVIAIFGGILAALTAYLILGSEFLRHIWPGLSYLDAVGIFWLLSSLPLFFRNRTFFTLESLGAILMAIIILGLGAYGFVGKEIRLPQVGPFSFILPFGPLIFALAGWTAVEPIVKTLGKTKKATLFFLGSILVSLLYLLFVFGILRSAAKITPDTISGLAWSPEALLILGILGLFAIWTSYLPSALEIKNSLKFAHLPKGLGFMVFLILPLALIIFGINNFLAVVSVGGGIFIALEYLLILVLGLKVLKPKIWERALIIFSGGVFLLGALYEIFFFLKPIS